MIKRLGFLLAALLLAASPVKSDFGAGGQLQGFWAVTTTPFSLTQTDDSIDTVNRSTYTFLSQAFGTTDASRYIAVGFYGGSLSTPTVSSVTIGGVTASAVVSVSSSNARTAIYIAAVPTGTSGDVVITFSAGVARCGLVVWRLVGANPTATATASDTVPSPANALSASLTIPTGGGGVGYAGFIASSGDVPRTATWTNLTEGADAQIEVSSAHSAALSTTAGSATRTMTTNDNMDTIQIGAVFAAWGP